MPGSKKRIFDGLTKDARYRLRNLAEYREKRRLYQKKWRSVNREKHNAISRAYHAKNKDEQHYRTARRDYHLRKTYGIGLCDFQEMAAAQGNLCAICRVDFASLAQRAIHIDHDHANGRVRGLLCHSCNTKLGWYERMSQSITSYLAEHSAKECS